MTQTIPAPQHALDAEGHAGSGRVEHHDVIVIGAGQAGLATGYYLAQHGLDFVILDAGGEVGEAWSKRWDSLRLFSPARYNSLPGFPFPAAPYHLPTKDEVAAYFKAYVARFELPVRLGVRVTRMRREGRHYVLDTAGARFTAAQVVVAVGTFDAPRIPGFARELGGEITQLHSSQYRNPGQIAAGSVLVVGAGNSGAQIAVDLARTHEVYLAGRDPGSTPRTILGRDAYWWMYATGLGHLSRGNWLGRELGLAKDNRPGRVGARMAMPQRSIVAAGVRWVPRVVGVAGGLPVLKDGRALAVKTVIWATGYRPDYGWVEPMPLNAHGYPQHERGVIKTEAGLYVMGLVFQYRLNSHMVGGVARDAEYLAQVIAECQDLAQGDQATTGP